jgi:hypothetical protein
VNYFKIYRKEKTWLRTGSSGSRIRELGVVSRLAVLLSQNLGIIILIKRKN